MFDKALVPWLGNGIFNPMNNRKELSNRLFLVVDKIDKVKYQLRQREMALLNKLPMPSALVDMVSGLVARLAFVVDDPCPTCQSSPQCMPWCPTLSRSLREIVWDF